MLKALTGNIMKLQSISPTRFTRPRLLTFFSMTSLVFSMAIFCCVGQAQQSQQLSLADVLIGLRSKKVTLDERNKLLSDAVKVRGITFSLTPEIETELAGTGANKELVEAIKQKSVKEKVVAPPPPDFAFYRKRADENVGKGELDLAVNDYNKAIELNPKDAATYLNRGRVYSNKKSFDLAALDYDKTIELNPKEPTAYLNRGDLHEKRGNTAQAMSDYQKVIELDASNETAKNNLKRLREEQAKIEQARIEQAKVEQAKVEQAKIEQAKLSAKLKEPEPKAATESSKTTLPPGTIKSVELGSLVPFADKMVTPVYPKTARQLNLTGQVLVQIALDEEGNVVSAKATTGPPLLRSASEEAARRSKFKPAKVGDQAVKGTGFIVFNFSNK